MTSFGQMLRESYPGTPSGLASIAKIQRMAAEMRGSALRDLLDRQDRPYTFVPDATDDDAAFQLIERMAVRLGEESIRWMREAERLRRR